MSGLQRHHFRIPTEVLPVGHFVIIVVMFFERTVTCYSVIAVTRRHPSRVTSVVRGLVFRRGDVADAGERHYTVLYVHVYNMVM